MSRKLMKFLILFDNSNLLFFPGQFLSGRVILEVDDDMPVLGKCSSLPFPGAEQQLVLEIAYLARAMAIAHKIIKSHSSLTNACLVSE